MFCVDDPEWDSIIDNGIAGISRAEWSPDGKNILIWGEGGIKISVWSIVKECLIKEVWNVKNVGESCVSWRKGGGFVGVVVEDEEGEGICVYETGLWRRAVRFGVAGLDRIGGVVWGGQGRVLIVWEGGLHCRVVLLSPAGYELGFWEDERAELGIRNVKVSPDHKLVAVGGVDGVVRILSVRSLKLLAVFDHGSPEIADQAPPLIYRELLRSKRSRSTRLDTHEDCGNRNPNVTKSLRRSQIASRLRKEAEPKSSLPRESYFEIEEVTDFVDIHRNAAATHSSSKTPKEGIGTLVWAPRNYYIATRNDSASNVVFVWDILHMRLVSLIVLQDSTRDIIWEKPVPSLKSEELASDDEDGEDLSEENACSPSSGMRTHLPASHEAPRVAVVAGNKNVYLWSTDGAAAINVPGSKNFGACKLQWATGNTALLVADNLQAKCFSLMYP